jgi:hypothetical protein
VTADTRNRHEQEGTPDAQLELVTADTSQPIHEGPATGRNSSAQLELVTEAMPVSGADVVPGRLLATSLDFTRHECIRAGEGA